MTCGLSPAGQNRPASCLPQGFSKTPPHLKRPENDRNGFWPFLSPTTTRRSWRGGTAAQILQTFLSFAQNPPLISPGC
jgi:hypothetical protein